MDTEDAFWLSLRVQYWWLCSSQWRLTHV